MPARAPATSTYDCLIVGGGPAGLSAALTLGRCCRRVLVCDEGRPRNRHAMAAHGFLTRDGVPPLEILRLGREQLRPYGVEVRRAKVVDARRTSGGFEVTLARGTRLCARTLLLATGVVDHLPTVPGLRECYGRSVHHCPYCDAWEVRGQPLAAFGHGERAVGLALLLTTWSSDVALCTDGRGRVAPEARAELARFGIALVEEPIARLDHEAGKLRALVFHSGRELSRRALFFNTGQQHRSPLALQLGCDMTARGVVRTGRFERTNVPGLFVAGDASRDVQSVVVAAAEGAKAAMAINAGLHAAERDRRRAWAQKPRAG
jgi:thioredoxin reductase